MPKANKQKQIEMEIRAEKIRELNALKYSLREIGKMLGISYETVRRLKNYKLNNIHLNEKKEKSG